MFFDHDKHAHSSDHSTALIMVLLEESVLNTSVLHYYTLNSLPDIVKSVMRPGQKYLTWVWSGQTPLV